jgi:hypothetical protein
MHTTVSTNLIAEQGHQVLDHAQSSQFLQVVRVHSTLPYGPGGSPEQILHTSSLGQCNQRLETPMLAYKRPRLCVFSATKYGRGTVRLKHADFKFIRKD